MKKLLIPSVLVVMSFPMMVLGQSAKVPVDLDGKSSIFLSFGAKANSRTVVSTSAAGVTLESGIIGLIGYAYWFDPEWQLNFTVGSFGAETSTGFRGVELNSTVPVLFGVSYYPLSLSMGSVGRPFAGVAAGAYVQSAARTLTTGTVESVNQTVLGGRLGVGVDIFAASWLRISPTVSYHLLGDFAEISPDAQNRSGAEFSVGFGVVF